jgi:FtsP/CotA-like multicopper oxidase with cupredoxin domain
MAAIMTHFSMKTLKTSRFARACAAAMLLTAFGASAANVTVNMTAQRMSTTLPDGSVAPMWGFCTTPTNGACSATWAPGPTIVAAAGDTLTIALKNSLPVATSIVILGQIGGTVGTPSMVPSPSHNNEQAITWPSPGASGDPTFSPPPQPARARSFSKEAAAAGSQTYVWNSLKPGTYLYETGSHPSLQAPMGLYGLLVVTKAPLVQSNAITPGQAYTGAYPTVSSLTNVPYDAQAVLLFSEIDPIQNTAVDKAANAHTDEYKISTDPSCATAPCYPPAVNYNPVFFLINGKPFDRANPAPAAAPIPAVASSGNVLLRFANAGLRTHIPTVVGLNMSLIAEDGNVAPGNPKQQSELLLTAGKTLDVLVKPAKTGSAFKPATYALFDRQLSLSNDNQPNGGMQGFLQVAGGTTPAAVNPTAVNDNFTIPPNSSVFAANVLLNDIAIANPKLGTAPSSGSVVLNADGTFTYTPNGNAIVNDTFTYFGNGKPTLSATVRLTVDGTRVGAAPVANPDTFVSNTGFSAGMTIMSSGVLGNDTDPSGYALKAVLVAGSVSSGVALQLNADGSFKAVPSAAGDFSFKYRAVNSQGTQSAPATVSLSFRQASGVQIAVVDALTKVAVDDYRWTIEEDRTFHNAAQLSSGGVPNILGTNFHASHMPVVATGCTGPASCGDNQKVNGAAVPPKARTKPSDVALDPTKYYYLSVLPADAADADPEVPKSGHTMGGVALTPADLATTGPAKPPVVVTLPPSPLKPAQLSIFVFEDNNPTNGGVDAVEEGEGLGGFAVTIMDTAGHIGDVAGQMTYDVNNMPLTNALFELDPVGCPRPARAPIGAAGVENRIGVIYTCPEYDDANDPRHLTRLTLAGHALVQNINPGRYDVMVAPGADRAGKGETWLQVSTLEGTRANDAFAKSGEPGYFQEYGPPGFHAFVGFVNPDRVNKLINPATPVNQGGLCRPTAGNPNPCRNTVTGRVTNLHMSRPSQTDLFDSASNDVLSGSTCYVGLNSVNGTGPNIAFAPCDADGNFKFTGVPDDTYQIVVWDQWLDQIVQYKSVTVPATAGATTTAVGNVPVLSWFTNIEQNAFMDLNGDGVQQDSEPGIAQIPMTVRYRDGSVGYISATDSSGNGSINELFPLFNWYVAESDTTRYKGTQVSTVVDGGGPLDSSGAYQGLLTSTYPHGPGDAVQSTVETFPGDTLSFGIQGFISQTNIINWGKRPYAVGENGGITGMVVYTSTRGFDDPRLEVQFNWEPAVPRVKVRLYRETVAPDGTTGMVLVQETTSSSWDDNLPTNCPGQRSDDPFLTYTLGAANRTKCYDGFHNWNQTRPAVYDGRYRFSGIAAGKYVVEVVPPEGYEIVKEEDKNILLGDAFVAPVAQQFAGVGNIFILPDQATVNAAASAEPGNAFPPCVGDLHKVPDFVSLFPGLEQASPFAGASRPLCNRKSVVLNDQMQATADFHLFTPTPIAAHYTGMILDDASSEFNPAAPDFGEKFAVPFVPVSMKDFNGVEISRVYADQWGMFNGLLPSTWQANVPNPSGYAPNMVTNCMNDPGPIKDPVTGKMITDPMFNPMYSNFCYTNPFMPGSTTYLDTPVLPIAAFAAGYFPVDCSYPDATPAIRRVDDVAGNFGPYLKKTDGRGRAVSGALKITALGDVQVPNPAYAGPTATSAPGNQKTITRHYGFGTVPGVVKLGNVTLLLLPGSWSDGQITALVPPNTPSGQLSITAANGLVSVDTVTVTIEDKAPTRVRASNGQSIQAAIDAAAPGDLILVDEGSYNELVIMWKPVRLQGVGAASVIVNAAKYPNEKLAAWRPRVNSLFGIDASGNLTLPAQVDPLPGQEISGGIVLLEPTVLSTEEGAGITVLAKNYPSNHCNARGNDPSADTWKSNFYCGQSRIDGISVTGGDSGGGIYVNGWAHNLQIANNRIYGNAGTYTGGIRIGQPNLEGLETLSTPFGFDKNVNIHHNAITTNGTIEAQVAESGGGGGLSVCSGTDNYSVNYNFICGNLSMGDGGGMAHVGYSGGANTIANNVIVFNQSLSQSATISGGGLVIEGATPAIGATSLGSGNVTVDMNQIQGNQAASGNGGGVYLQDLGNSNVVLTNNMVVNNVAGYSGGGVSLQNAASAKLINNTVAHNDSTATIGAAFSLPNSPTTSKSQPAGISSDPVSRNAALINNIIWENRSFFFAAATNSATGFQLNPVVTGCGGSSVNANYWDLGVIGQAQAAPVLKLNPSYSVLTSTDGYANQHNISSNPLFVTAYCNGARFIGPPVPESPAPTVPFTMQAAGAVDEGGNWIEVRYGPISLSDPLNQGLPGVLSPPIGDYHIRIGSMAIDNGTMAGAPNHDFDSDRRLLLIDIGADEWR